MRVPARTKRCLKIKKKLPLIYDNCTWMLLFHAVVLFTFAPNYKGCLVDLQIAIFSEQTAKVFKTKFAKNHSLLPGYRCIYTEVEITNVSCSIWVN